MTANVLRDVLEATGYLANGTPADGVYLGEEAEARHRMRSFCPDALWRSASALTVYFKCEEESSGGERVAEWHREIWNQGFAPLLWVISPDRIAVYNGFGRPQEAGNASAHLLDTFETIEAELERLDTLAGRLAMETGQFWGRARTVDRRTSVDRQLLSDLSALESDLTSPKVKDNLASVSLGATTAQGLIGRAIFTQYLNRSRHRHARVPGRGIRLRDAVGHSA